MVAVRCIFEKLRCLGPYLLIELLLPGGTLLALALWLYRRREALCARHLPPAPGPAIVTWAE